MSKVVCPTCGALQQGALALDRDEAFSTKQPAILREALRAGRTVFLGPDRWRLGDKEGICLEDVLRDMRFVFPDYDDETLVDRSGDFVLASHFLRYAEPAAGKKKILVDLVQIYIAEDWAGIPRVDLAFDAVLAALKMERFGFREQRKDYVTSELRINSKYVVKGPDPDLRAKAAKLPAGQSLWLSGIVPPVQVAAHGVTEERRLAEERWLEAMKAKFGSASPASGQDAAASLSPPLKVETPASEPRNQSKGTRRNFLDFLDSGED
jgi:hypothetical protein